MTAKLCLAAAFAIAIATPLAAQSPPKLDKALLQSLKSGCSSEQVIIRTKPGYRAGLSQSLQAHGDKVTAEHPTIDAVTAELRCEDLAAVAGFDEVLSISYDSLVSADGLSTHRPRIAALPSDASSIKKHRSSIAAPKRDARESANDDDNVEDEFPGARGARVVRTRDGLLAEAAQHAFFNTLGVYGRRWPSRVPSSVMLGDIISGPGHDDGGENFHEAARGWKPIGIAVIDSGIEPGDDFGDRITHFYDFTSGRARRTRPSDPYGHGTHVAGLIGSAFVGIAPEVRLVGLRVLDAQGQGRTTNVIRAIEFATANRVKLGIRAINISLGHPVFEPAATDPLVQAVEQAVRAGLVVITSAGNVGINPATGNPGYAGMFSPANAPSALTVGSLKTFDTPTRADDRVAPYSSRGPSWYDAFPKPDVVAPGHNMLSVAAAGSKLRKEHEKRGGTGGYMRLSGTSMAAGVAAGVVTLMLQTNAHLTPNALKMVLEFTAVPVRDANGQPFDVLSQGAGAVNASGAIRLGMAIDARKPIGHKWLTVGMPFRSTIAGEAVAWSQTMIWGPHRVLGDGIVDENRIAWATSVVWGSGVEDDNIVWGTGEEDDTVVWGTRFDEGDNIVWGTNFIWSDSFADNIVWGTFFEDDNIVWGTNIVWGNALIGVLDEADNIVWGTMSAESDNIVWGTMTDDNIVWGTLYERNIVWGTLRLAEEADNIVWGTSIMLGDRVVSGARPSTQGSR